MEEIFDENQPIYLQIVQRICAQILRGEFKPGDKLPAVIDAAMRFKVNHNTIHRAYLELIRQGIAVTRRGEGTFVTADQSVLDELHHRMRKTFLEDFIRQMRQLGFTNADIIETLQSYLQSANSKEEKQS
ncbi:MAG: GntR family transcriptional regulator [Chloroflexi bacterium]|nr:GntR family transcriptional regulator [Chloroflexota bacterium]